MIKKKLLILLFPLVILLSGRSLVQAQEAPPSSDILFDDKMLIDGYSQKYSNESKDVLLAMIEDDTLSPYQIAASVRVFRERYVKELFLREKAWAERVLWRSLNRTDSQYVKIEIMHTLCFLDRYKYFRLFIPTLINILDHYNKTVNEFAYNAIDSVIKAEDPKRYEAKIIFYNLRKNLILSRKKLRNLKEVNPRLQKKLDLIRWSLKILGTQELRKLPSEVIDLL
jgi:hypothetical protein